MELSSDWHKKTNVRLFDILSDILKESKPHKVQKPTHGYEIAENAPEIVTAHGAYFPAEKGEVIPLESRQLGGRVVPKKSRIQQLEEAAGISEPTPTPETVPAPEPPPVTPPPKGFIAPPYTGPGPWRKNIPDQREPVGMVTPKPTGVLQGILQKLASYAPFAIGGGATQPVTKGRMFKQNELYPISDIVGKTPLLPRQNGGEVDPSLFKETFSVNYGSPTQEGIDTAANTALVNPTPIVPTLPLQSYAPRDGINPTPAAVSTPLTGMAEYEANARRIRGLPPETGIQTVNQTGGQSNQILGGLSAYAPPAFKENTRSPMFGSDQSVAYNKKYGIDQEPDLYERLKASSDLPGMKPTITGVPVVSPTKTVRPTGTPMPPPPPPNPADKWIEEAEKKRQQAFRNSLSIPLLSRQGGGPTSPDPDEGLTEEERKRRAAAAMQKTEPLEDVLEMRKEVLPTGQTRYVLPGTEGTATVGPERFFVGEKEVPAGTPGAVSGDELARQDVLKKATLPELKLPERGYYEAHPEERFMDIGIARNKSLEDAFQKLTEENTRRVQGFGLPMDTRAARVIQAEAARAAPELAKGLEQTMALNLNVPGTGKVGTPHWTQDPKTGEVVAIYPARVPGATHAISPTGFIAKTPASTEKSPTELGLIAKSNQIGPDGKPTAEAIEAQKILDTEMKRKLQFQGGGTPTLTEVPPHPLGQKYNEAALEGVDPGFAATVKKLVNYEIPLPSSFALSRPYWQNILARASAYDPTFDAIQYPVKFGVRKSFTSGKDKDNLVALNTAVGHINSLVKAKDELANSNWVRGNQAINLLAKEFPITKELKERQGTVTGVKTKFNAVKGEMANIFKRSGATDQEIKSWNDTITDPSTATPASWKAFIDGALELMGSRIEALRNTYERGIGAPKDFAFLSPKSKTILERLGVDVNAIDPVAGTSTSEQRQTEKVSPRLPGETVQEYIKRTGGK